MSQAAVSCRAFALSQVARTERSQVQGRGGGRREVSSLAARRAASQFNAFNAEFTMLAGMDGWLAGT